LQNDFHQLFEAVEKLIARPKGNRLEIARELEERFGFDVADYVAAALKLGMPFTHIVVPVHGIRDDGGWFEVLQQAFKKRPDIQVAPGGYGYLHVSKFLREGRRQPIYEQVVSTLRSAQGQNRVVSVLCHSFGTYCVTRAILENPDIRLFRLIMCGSIVPREFPWDRVPAPLPAGRVVNDCGNLDIWPVIVQRLTKVFGNTGRLGFAHHPVSDRWHNVDHSGFFTNEIVTKYWAPFLAEGKVVKSPAGLLPPRGFLKFFAGRWP
jgi:hypothetical protein